MSRSVLHLRFTFREFASVLLRVKTGSRKDQDLDSKDLLTAKEVAKMLSISVKTVYGYASRGLIPYVRIQSNVRFLKSEILSWVAERRFRPKPLSSPK